MIKLAATEVAWSKNLRRELFDIFFLPKIQDFNEIVYLNGEEIIGFESGFSGFRGLDRTSLVGVPSYYWVLNQDLQNPDSKHDVVNFV